MRKKDVFYGTALKATPRRAQVLEALAGGGGLSARDLWQKLLAAKKNMSFVTVYRALSTLADAGLVRKIPTEKGALYESAAAGALPHLVCSRCGKVEEVRDKALLRYNASVIKNRSLARRDSLLLYADCKRKKCRGSRA